MLQGLSSIPSLCLPLPFLWSQKPREDGFRRSYEGTHSILEIPGGWAPPAASAHVSHGGLVVPQLTQTLRP